ncbi:MAG: hypothetical protein VX344_05370 [Bacteroidota bacterium]|nr:hypothetical protein [Bacteroidota bacterium]
MNYYVDGNITLEDFNFKKEDQLYSSVYSSSLDHFKMVELDAQVHQTIVQKSFKSVASVYNNLHSIFSRFESIHHFNPWFLEHFRLYFNYRNSQLKIACISLFFNEFPDGKVITSNRELKHQFSEKRLLFVKKRKVKFSTYKTAYSEIKKILFSKRPLFKDGEVLVFRSKRSSLGKLESSYQLFSSRNILESASDDINHYDSDFVLKQYLLSFSWIKDISQLIQSFRMLVAQLRSVTSESPESNDIINLFISQLSSQYLYYLRLKSFCKFFHKHNIKAIILNDENSPQMRVIQYAAKQNGVKVYAYQHGTIHSLHPAYMYGLYNHKPLLADTTFLWGEYFQRLLLQQGGYSMSNLSLSGKIVDSHKHMLSTDFPSEKKVVLFATQPQRDPLMRKMQIQDVMHALKSHSDTYQLVIRPHPNEIDDDYFLQIANECGYNHLIIDRLSDLHSHFENCSVMITSFSTVGAEFIPYYKPMIVLDYLQQDLIGYIKQGVGIGVRNRKALEEVFSKKMAIDISSYDAFIKDYFYKLDNKAEQRIMDKISADFISQSD